MRMTTGRLAAMLTLALMATPEPASAQSRTPRVLLEKSATYALDNQYRSFRVPTIDSNGRTQFFDVTVRLSVNANGTIGTSAAVTSAKSVEIKTGQVQPGTYRAAGGETCRVKNATNTNGRIQSFFTCTTAANPFELSVATGRAVAGHPFFAQLQRTGVDKLPDADTYTLGIVTNGRFSVGSCGTYFSESVLGAKTDGSQLTLFMFNNNAEIDCAATFVRQ